MALENRTALTLRQAIETGKGIIPIGQEGNAFCITSYTGDYADTSVNCLVSQMGIFLTEEPVTSNDLIKSVFEEEGEQSGFYFTNTDLQSIIDEDPTLLVHLYSLFENTNSHRNELISIINNLIDGGYHPERVILSLLALSRQEIIDIIEAKEVIAKFEKLIS